MAQSGHTVLKSHYLPSYLSFFLLSYPISETNPLSEIPFQDFEAQDREVQTEKNQNFNFENLLVVGAVPVRSTLC